MDTLQANDLVMLLAQKGEAEAPKYRTVCIIPHDGGDDFAWIGPTSLTPGDLDEFVQLLLAGMPRPSKFDGCMPVPVSQLVRVLDS